MRVSHAYAWHVLYGDNVTFYLRMLKLQNQLIMFLDKFSILLKVTDDIRMSNLEKPVRLCQNMFI